MEKYRLDRAGYLLPNIYPILLIYNILISFISCVIEICVSSLPRSKNKTTTDMYLQFLHQSEQYSLRPEIQFFEEYSHSLSSWFIEKEAIKV